MISRVKSKNLPDFETPVQIALLRDNRDALFDRNRILRNIYFVDPGRTSVGTMEVVKTPIVVVLPAPFGPKRPKISPRETSKETPSTAFVFDFG